MPRNASGTFAPPAAYNPVVVDELITAVWANTTINDIAQGLTDSLDRQGRGGMLAPFKLSDGTLAAPGIAFLNETSTGLGRLASSSFSGIVSGTEIFRVFVDRFEFYKPPRFSEDPVADNDLVRLAFSRDTYAPLIAPVFDPTSQLTWDGVPNADASLVNKLYVDQLAFNTALPGVASQDIGAQVYVNPTGVAQWSQEPAELQALAILNFIGA